MSYDTILSAQGAYLLIEKLIKIKTNKCKRQPAINSRCELRVETISFIIDTVHLSLLSINWDSHLSCLLTDLCVLLVYFGELGQL